MARRNFGRELWDKCTDFARLSDDRPVYECGEWTIQKLYFLSAYLAQTTQAMKGNQSFASLNYIDLFSGCGICSILTENGTIRRYPGSALLAAGCEKQFDNLFLIDDDEDNINAIKRRIKSIGCTAQIWSRAADANKIIAKVADSMPDHSLNVAFVDPYSLDIEYETIRALAEKRPLDLLILFADGTDLIRNVEINYYPKPNGKLDRFLGHDSNWRAQWDALENRDAAHLRQLFGEIYCQQLTKIGYQHTDSHSINDGGRSKYQLIYAYKHPLGLKFWHIAKREDLHHNRNLWGVP